MRTLGSRHVTRTLAVGVLTAFSACVLPDIDFTGKTCPCHEPEFRCNEVTSTCEREGDSTAVTGGDCTPLAVSQGFRIGWETPNGIYWQWDPPANLDMVQSYRIVLGPTEDAVLREVGATTFTAPGNPELGGTHLVKTDGVDPVRATITGGLQPSTTYFAKLVTTDNAGCGHASNVLSATTAFASTDGVVLFEDTPPADASFLPSSIVVEPSCPGTGSPCLAYTSPAQDYENVRMQFTLPGSELDLSDGDFATAAYLELRIGTDSVSGPTWSEVRLGVGADFYALAPVVFDATGDMRFYQYPLRVLMGSDSQPLTRQDLEGGVTEFGIGTEWSAGSHAWLDDVQIRW